MRAQLRGLRLLLALLPNRVYRMLNPETNHFIGIEPTIVVVEVDVIKSHLTFSTYYSSRLSVAAIDGLDQEAKVSKRLP